MSQHAADADSIELTFTVNGVVVSVTAPPQERLSNILREHLGLKGTKIGCDAGDCGACTVLLEGTPVCACMVPGGRLDGREVITIEGLAANTAVGEPLQRSFLAHGAAQCGICTPGMLVTAAALLTTTPQPSTADVEDALGGVLCRCTGYRKIVAAVQSAGDQRAPAAAPGGAVGQRQARIDGWAKLTGDDLFGDDAAPADALTLKVVRSPYHHARFEFGAVESYVRSKAGIALVLTAEDIPGDNVFGVIPTFRDQPVFAEAETRFMGEAVAAVIGEAHVMQDFDPREFPVTFTELPPLLDTEGAQTTGAETVHDTRSGNVLTEGFVERGDVEQALAQSAFVAEGEFSTGFVEHAYIEPESGYAVRRGDRLEVYGCTQAPHMDREELARIMALQPEDIRVLPSAVGGGFGSKLDLSFQPMLALAAWRLDRAVRVTYSRPESMRSTTKRHPSRIQARVGTDTEGHLTAMSFFGEFNTGAYASWGPTVANRVPVHASGPYRLKSYQARSRAVHTHSAPAGAFRGFGVPQSAIAQEVLFDELAARLGHDRLAFRIKNALVAGDQTVTGQTFNQGVGIRACLAALEAPWADALEAVAVFNADTTDQRRRGVGVASCWYGCGNTSLPNPSTIKLGLTPEGRVRLYQGAVDIGQGSNTVVAQICAQTLGLEIEHFDLISADTDSTPDAGKTSASRQTFVSGKAAMLSGTALKRAITSSAGLAASSSLRLDGDRVIVSDGHTNASIELAELPVNDDGLVFVAEETFDPPTTPLDENGQGEPYASFGYGAQVAVVEVDTKLGTVRVCSMTAAHDVGCAINPTLVEGQIEGGIAQGIGMALMESWTPGRTDNLHDYLIPTFGDVPDIDIRLIEDPDALGPYGAKGLGEHVLIPTAPAILNAIRHATGAVLRHLPATPERVLAAIRDAESAG